MLLGTGLDVTARLLLHESDTEAFQQFRISLLPEVYPIKTRVLRHPLKPRVFNQPTTHPLRPSQG